MRSRRLLPLMIAVLLASSVTAHAQSLGDVFKRVNASVVTIRTKGTEVSAQGELTGFTGVIFCLAVSPAAIAMAEEEITALLRERHHVLWFQEDDRSRLTRDVTASG